MNDPNLTSALIEAQEVAGDLLSECFAENYLHSLAVGTRAFELADDLGYSQDICIRMRISGILHDIGRAPGLVTTGVSTYDGGLFLAQQLNLAKFAPNVCWHGQAAYEGARWGLYEPDIPKPVLSQHRILWVADMTTSLSGEPIAIQDRISALKSRHKADSPVILALDDSFEDLAAAARFCGVDHLIKEVVA